ncbi:MAG TPA: TolC family protein [Gemmatimonadaceae bacterium]|nr:TolC family protein [Gemmatimonadaceae bacterium]
MMSSSRSALTALLVCAVAARAQSPGASSAAPAGGLTLQAAIDAALTGNSQIRNDWLQVEGFRGQLLAKSAPFDMQVHSAVSRRHDNPQLASSEFVGEQATNYELSVSRQLHSGVTLSPSVQVARSQYGLPNAPATGTATVGISAQVPLLYDRGGAVTATALRVGEYDLDGIRGSWKTSVTVNVNATATAYWNYVAAVERLSAQREAEVRAQRLLDETTQLVRNQERAPADLEQLRANLAAKRGARILAEQSVVESRVQLGSTMGLDASHVMALPLPATEFPVPPDSNTNAASSSASSIERLVALARDRRPDLAAAQSRIHAWDLELKQFHSAVLPHFDLVMNLGYQGFTIGAGYNPLVSPLYRNVPGLNATLEFRYDAAVDNSGARGQLAQEAASVGQQHIALHDVERQVITDVETAAAGVDRSVLALRESQAAVALFRRTVDNEKRKLQLGMSTLFDVLNAEDALTNALLTDVNNRRTYAAALASLRVATGTLADIHDDTPHVDAARLLVAP